MRSTPQRPWAHGARVSSTRVPAAHRPRYLNWGRWSWYSGKGAKAHHNKKRVVLLLAARSGPRRSTSRMSGTSRQLSLSLSFLYLALWNIKFHPWFHQLVSFFLAPIIYLFFFFFFFFSIIAYIYKYNSRCPTRDPPLRKFRYLSGTVRPAVRLSKKKTRNAA